MQRITSIATLLLLAGCAPAVRSTTFRAELPPPRSADHPIQVYHTQLPPCPYEELGLAHASQSTPLVSMRAVQEALLQRARKMGGDALIGVAERREAAGMGDGVAAERTLSGTVVRFPDDCPALQHAGAGTR